MTARICAHGRQLCHCGVCAPLADALYRLQNAERYAAEANADLAALRYEQQRAIETACEWHPSYREIL